MNAKYLFSHARVDIGDKKEEIGNVIVLTLKTDIFQHRDMANVVNIHPSWGGFANRLSSVETVHLYGESISCRVGTDKNSVDGVMKPHLLNADWFKYPYQKNGKTYTIFMGTEKGHTPNAKITGIEWIPCEFKDIKPIMTKEIGSYYDW